MDLRAYARAREAVLREDTDEDFLKKTGISEQMITEVMTNIERASR